MLLIARAELSAALRPTRSVGERIVCEDCNSVSTSCWFINKRTVTERCSGLLVG